VSTVSHKINIASETPAINNAPGVINSNAFVIAEKVF
jgi:hypothetical protein